MPVYRNTVTGVTVKLRSEVRGGDWELVPNPSPSVKAEKAEPKKEIKKKPVRKTKK